MTEKDELERRTCARLLDCLDDLDDHKNDLRTWTDSLEELSEIEDAFEADKKDRLHGKTVLDIGTDCVKPLYIALKLEPRKIIEISEDLSAYSFASNLEQKFKLFTDTEIYTIVACLMTKTSRKLLETKNLTLFWLVRLYITSGRVRVLPRDVIKSIDAERTKKVAFTNLRKRRFSSVYWSWKRE